MIKGETICRRCHENLKNFYDFRTTVEKAQEKANRAIQGGKPRYFDKNERRRELIKQYYEQSLFNAKNPLVKKANKPVESQASIDIVERASKRTVASSLDRDKIDDPLQKKIKIREVTIEEEKIQEKVVPLTRHEALLKLPKGITVRVKNIRSMQKPQQQPEPKKITVEAIAADWDFVEEETNPLNVEIKEEKENESTTIKMETFDQLENVLSNSSTIATIIKLENYEI